MQATDLDFKRIEISAKAPFYTCNCCGKKVKANTNSWFATFKIVNHDIIFFLCSDTCYVTFHSVSIKPYVKQYLEAIVMKIALRTFLLPESYNNFLKQYNIEP